MAGMRMTALAAGFGAALAAGPDDASAQATEIVIPLETGGEIVMNVADVAHETQTAIMNHLDACIGAAETTRDECVAEAATMMAQNRLDAVVTETHARLSPLGDEIGLTVAELVQEPDFCYAASTPASVEICQTSVGGVRLAAAEYELATVRERRIAAETRVAAVDTAIESEQALGRRLDADGAEIAERADAETERADANAAVLAALQRVAAAERSTN